MKELKFTEYMDNSKTYTEEEAVRLMDERFAKGESFIGHWDNGYSYCGADRLNCASGAEVVKSLKRMVAEKYPDREPTDEQLCDYSGYSWDGIICDRTGRFKICMARFTKRWSEVSDS